MSRKDKTSKHFTNFKMNDKVYEDRRKVMFHIYELINEQLKLPRIDVRIGTDKHKCVLGRARLNKNIIWITKKAVDGSIDDLRQVVYHELLHTIYGCNHKRGCPIMSASQPQVVLNKVGLIGIFKEYYSKYN